MDESLRVSQAPTSDAYPPPPQYPPVPLPSTYPSPAVATNNTVPTHFGLFGYSFDGSVVNQSYYSNGKPFAKDAGGGFTLRPQDTLKNHTYGSYAFSIGPAGHLFARNNGKIAIMQNDNEDIGYLIFVTWASWWKNGLQPRPRDPIPTCTIIPDWNVLQCNLNGSALTFGWCTTQWPPFAGTDPGAVVWGTDTSACTEIVLNVRQVPASYGHQFPEAYCAAHPDDLDCPRNGTRV